MVWVTYTLFLSTIHTWLLLPNPNIGHTKSFIHHWTTVLSQHFFFNNLIVIKSMPRSRVICVWGPSFLSASPTPYPISPQICLGSGLYYWWFYSPTWPGLPATGPNMNSTGCLIVNSIYANSNPCWQTAVYLPSDPLYISHSCLIYEKLLVQNW
jgi:hypothetical protein